MVDRLDQDPSWWGTAKVLREMRVSSCHLMHLRLSGKVAFKRQGNAFLYSSLDVMKIKSSINKASKATDV